MLKQPSNADAFEVLCLQAADEGRGPVLFGDSLPRARKAGRSFLLEGEFPDVYLEFPLIGAPFLDVTVLYGTMDSGVRRRMPRSPAPLKSPERMGRRDATRSR